MLHKLQTIIKWSFSPVLMQMLVNSEHQFSQRKSSVDSTKWTALKRYLNHTHARTHTHTHTTHVVCINVALMGHFQKHRLHTSPFLWHENIATYKLTSPNPILQNYYRRCINFRESLSEVCIQITKYWKRKNCLEPLFWLEKLRHNRKPG